MKKTFKEKISDTKILCQNMLLIFLAMSVFMAPAEAGLLLLKRNVEAIILPVFLAVFVLVSMVRELPGIWSKKK